MTHVVPSRTGTNTSAIDIPAFGEFDRDIGGMAIPVSVRILMVQEIRKSPAEV